MVNGALLMLEEQCLHTEKTGPLLPEFRGINQLIRTPVGRAFSAKEVVDMAKEICFTDLSYRLLSESSPFTLITGTKP